MRRPPQLRSAETQARQGSDQATRDEAAEYAGRWRRVNGYHATVADALEHVTAISSREEGTTPSGRARLAVDLVSLDGGQLLLDMPDARAVRDDWLADPRSALERMRACLCDYELRPGGPTGAPWVATPYRCNQPRICPVCASAEADRRRDELLHVVLELARRGYQVVLATRSRPTDTDPQLPLPVMWTGEDATRWGEYPGVTQMWNDDVGSAVGRAVPGETLGCALDSYFAALTETRDSVELVEWRGARRRRRDVLRETVACSVDAVEATQVLTDRYGRVRCVRWHVHGHVIYVLVPGTIDVELETRSERRRSKKDGRPGRVRRLLSEDCEWWRLLRDTWVEVVDGAPQAQDAELIVGDDERELWSALSEALKYPGKLSEMSVAGVLEWLVSVKGRHLVREGAALHASTRVGSVAHAIDVERRSVDDDKAAQEWARVQGVYGIQTSAELAMHRRLTAAELKVAQDVGAAFTVAAGRELEELEDGPASARVWTPPLLESDGNRPRILTMGRLGALLRAGITSTLAWHGQRTGGATMGELDLVAVRRSVSTWRARSVLENASE